MPSVDRGAIISLLGGRVGRMAMHVGLGIVPLDCVRITLRLPNGKERSPERQFDTLFGSRWIFVFSLIFTYLMPPIHRDSAQDVKDGELEIAYRDDSPAGAEASS